MNSSAFGLLASPHSGICGISHSFMAGMDVAKGGGDAAEQVELQCAAATSRPAPCRARPVPNSAGSGCNLLEIAADRDGFGEDGAVVEFQHRQPLQRIARADRLLPCVPARPCRPAPAAPRCLSRPGKCAPGAGSAPCRRQTASCRVLHAERTKTYGRRQRQNRNWRSQFNTVGSMSCSSSGTWSR